MTFRNKPADVVFVLDATSSTQCVFRGMVMYIEDISFTLKTVNRHALFKYGAVVYRDPVFDKPKPASKPIDPEAIAEYQRLLAQLEEERKKKLDEKGFYDEEMEALRRKHFENIDREKYPEDKNVAIPFSDNIEEIQAELDKVECGGGGDEQEDWVGALTLALDGLDWREGSKKCIILITDSNAHGKSFNTKGEDNYNDEEEKLKSIFERMARERVYFIVINIMKRDEGCKLTAQAMKEVYEDCGGPGFVIQDFEPEIDEDLGDDDWPPTEFGKFADTLVTTTSGVRFE